MSVKMKNTKSKSSSNYLKGLFAVCSFSLEKSPESYITQLLAVIQELLYSTEKERSIKKVLLLYNLTFVHVLLIEKYWENDLKILNESFLGVYYHSLMIHARK